MKEQKKEISTRQENRHSSRLNIFYFLPTALFLKQLPARIAKASLAKPETKVLSKNAILPAQQILHVN